MNLNDLHHFEKHAVPSHIVVTTQQDYPYSGYEEKDGKLIGKGYAFTILDLMSEYFNFTYTIKVPDEDAENDIEAVISLLFNKEVDVAVAFLPILPELRVNCTYGTVLDEMEVTFFMKRPPESATGSGLLAPFNVNVWILILITVLFVGPTIYILILLRSKFSKDVEMEKYSLNSCMWFVYGALLKQGTTMSPTSNSIRILFATWWIFNIILSSFYTANLTAFLTLSQFTLPIDSFETLVKKHMRWFTFKGKVIDYMITHNYTIVSDLQSSYYKYGEFLTDSNIIINNDVLGRIHEDAVFITETLYAKLNLYKHYTEKMFLDIKEEEKCEYVIMPGNIFKIDRAFAYSGRTTVYRQFNKLTKKLIEGGLIKFFKSQDLPEAIICPLDLASKERKLRLADLKMTYKIVISGFIIALIIFIVEVVHKYYSNRSKFTGKMGKNKKMTKKSSKAKGNAVNAYNENDLFKNNNYIRTIKVSPPAKSENIIKNINGREYYVIKKDGQNYQLIPIRTPSAIMYQHYR